MRKRLIGILAATLLALYLMQTNALPRAIAGDPETPVGDNVSFILEPLGTPITLLADTNFAKAFCAKFSYDSKMVAYGSRNIHIMDSVTHERIALIGNVPDAESIAFSHNGKRIAASNYDSKLAIITIETGEATSKVLDKTIYDMYFTPDDKFLVAQCRENIIVIDVATFEYYELLNFNGNGYYLSYPQLVEQGETGEYSIINIGYQPSDNAILTIKYPFNENKVIKERPVLSNDALLIMMLPHVESSTTYYLFYDAFVKYNYVTEHASGLAIYSPFVEQFFQLSGDGKYAFYFADQMLITVDTATMLEINRSPSVGGYVESSNDGQKIIYFGENHTNIIPVSAIAAAAEDKKKGTTSFSIGKRIITGKTLSLGDKKEMPPKDKAEVFEQKIDDILIKLKEKRIDKLLFSDNLFHGLTRFEHALLVLTDIQYNFRYSIGSEDSLSSHANMVFISQIAKELGFDQLSILFKEAAELYKWQLSDSNGDVKKELNWREKLNANHEYHDQWDKFHDKLIQCDESFHMLSYHIADELGLLVIE